MSISYGFYNSVNHDRKYNAEQISSIFDGIITDGVYHSIGDAFSVTPGTGMSVNVSSGRAWFNHTWTLNDSMIIVELTAAHQVYDRIDAIILKVDQEKIEFDIAAQCVKQMANLYPDNPILMLFDGITIEVIRNELDNSVNFSYNKKKRK